MTAADADIIRDIFHGDGVGVICGDKFDALLHIAVGRIAAVGAGRAVHKECEHGVEAAGHLHRVLEFVSAGIIDMQNLPMDGFAAGNAADIRMFRRKIGGI